MTEGGATVLIVGDRAVARLAAQAARTAPGVARLEQSPRQLARSASRRVANRVGPTRGDADPVDVERGPGRAGVVVRIAVDTSLPVREIVDGVQRRVAAELARSAGLTAVIVVHVLDVCET